MPSLQDLPNSISVTCMGTDEALDLINQIRASRRIAKKSSKKSKKKTKTPAVTAEQALKILELLGEL